MCGYRKELLTMGKRGRFTLVINFIIILSLMILGCKNMETDIKEPVEIRGYDLVRDISEVRTTSNVYKISERQVKVKVKEVIKEIKMVPKGYGKKLLEDLELSENDKYLLAKIAMNEAGNQNTQTKTLVIMSVLNRVESPDFPDSVSEVIFQKSDNVYQYSPLIPGGSWYRLEPNGDCYEALEVVLTSEINYSDGALYFESCEADSWHSRNLEFLYQSGDLRFYK